MPAFYARSVFFVRDAARSLEFYANTLGFALDWKHEHEDRLQVFQVSLLGFELILNQVESDTDDRPGHGRVFIGLDDVQAAALRQHIEDKSIRTLITHWGSPTVAICDIDQNELFFWLPEAERAKLESGGAGVA